MERLRALRAVLAVVTALVADGVVRWWAAFSIVAAMSAAIWLLFAYLMRFGLYPGVLFGGTLPPI